MNLKKAFLIQCVVFLVFVALISPCLSEVKPVRGFPRAVVIQSVSPDFTYFVIDKEKYLVGKKTMIVDEKGNVLKISDLKPQLLVKVESIPTQRAGRLTKKIVVMERRKP